MAKINDIEKNFQENLINDLIEYLKKNHPYPEDIFKYQIEGRSARVGYNACIYNIEKYLKNLKED